mmetsp:Transcript_32639/g.68936  ORF Transcript_32639/g.68936 Transcript_32639/m.68936 type:complete len:213 (-) Transcript_32639:175-813(-)
MCGEDGHETHGEQSTFHRGGGEPKHAFERPSRHGFRAGILTARGIQKYPENGPPRVHGETGLVRDASHQERGNDAEPRGDVTADVVEGHVVAKDVTFEEDGGELHARVDSGADGTTEGVPYHVIEPGEEFFGAMFIEVLSGPPIKVRIEFVNHRSKLLNRLKANGIGIGEKDANAVQDGTDPYQVHEVVGRGCGGGRRRRRRRSRGGRFCHG